MVRRWFVPCAPCFPTCRCSRWAGSRLRILANTCRPAASVPAWAQICIELDNRLNAPKQWEKLSLLPTGTPRDEDHPLEHISGATALDVPENGNRRRCSGLG